ncbi:MAG: Clp protease ClpP, partial [Saprospirales bacterium]|nr:Clp protease ClpP [Saprospirales bacterium]
MAIQDQLSNLNGKSIDIILETGGGIAEVVEDIVRILRSKYDNVGIIIPGTAKSAGTILSMAADEILMGTGSSLGPIDAQIITQSKRFSADAFLEGLEKIKADVIAISK